MHQSAVLLDLPESLEGKTKHLHFQTSGGLSLPLCLDKMVIVK